jgi:hypothetical protein
LPLASSIEPPTTPASAARRIVSAASAGASPKPFSRSAATGTAVAAAMERACAIASSRESSPSRRPSTPADALLDVASAWNPSLASAWAEPASHGFGITKARGPACRERKRVALSCWVGVIDPPAGMNFAFLLAHPS